MNLQVFMLIYIFSSSIDFETLSDSEIKADTPPKGKILNFNPKAKVKRNELNLSKYMNNSFKPNNLKYKPLKEFNFEEGIEDNFYTHLLDWNAGQAAIGTKSGLNLFRPLKSAPFSDISSYLNQMGNVTFSKIRNLLALKFINEESIFYSNNNSFLIQFDCI